MADLESRRAIDQRVDRLLRDADALRRFPTPVEDIIEAQRLKVSTPEDSPLSPGMLARAPQALQEKLAAVSFKVLAILDRRERMVHVSPDTDNANPIRFRKVHEVGHDLCEWQDLTHAIDGRSQLDPATRELFEREANYAAGRLLFQGEVFKELVMSYATGMASVVFLADQMGGSIHATFHQYVTTHLGSVAGYILRRSPIVDPASGVLRFGVKLELSSPRFTQTHLPVTTLNDVLSSETYPTLQEAWDQLSHGREYGCGELRLVRRDASEVLVPFELFSNTYNLFLLIDASSGRRLTRRTVFACADR